jgi:DNA replication licensing factor MCM2
MAAPHAAIPHDDEAEEAMRQRDLDDMLGENEVMSISEPSDAEELFDEDLLQKDYESNPELDQYSDADISEGSYDAVDMDTRREVEKELRERDWREGRAGMVGAGGRLPSALLEGDVSGVGDRPFMRRRRRGRRGDGGSSDEDEGFGGRRRGDGGDGGDGDDDSDDLDDDEDEPNLEQVQGSLREYILTVANSAIGRRFRRFLRTFEDEKGKLVYRERILELGKANKSSLELSWDHLSRGEEVPILATWLVEAPAQMLPILNRVARKEVLLEFPSYDLISPQIFVRVSSLPVADNLRDLRQAHLNALIRVNGVVTRRSSVMPQLLFTKYHCNNCSALLGPYSQENSVKEVKPSTCTACQSNGPFTLNMEQSVYRNYQTINLQETPGSIPPGRLPRSREAILHDDLVDSVRPGDEVAITGIYLNHFDGTLNRKNGFPVFKTLIEANHVHKREDAYDSFRLTEDDENAIRQLAKDPHIGERIIESIAPSIHGHLDIKTGLALALFGGEPKQLEGDHRTRGDINVLLLGDPGVAKSQFLKYMEKTAYRAVYTTGQGASAVGLTAAVRKDPVTREFTLEGGALVLADRGMCMIDEFDKMNDQDRTSIHEAMEQQSISISKAGIVTSLRARCSVIAAANPVRGRYDASLPFSKNVELSDAILSRFDITCVVRDIVDYDTDFALASFVIGSHARSHPLYKQGEEGNGNGSSGSAPGASNENMDIDPGQGENNGPASLLNAHHQMPTLEMMDVDAPPPQASRGAPHIITSSAARSAFNTAGPLSQDMLRKYVMYAKFHCHPRLTNESDVNKIVSVYVEMRKEGSRGGVPMTVRHVESMVRMAEAHAKMHLRTTCNDDDINMSIRVMLHSFIQSQKFSVSREMQKTFKHYLTYKRENNEILLALLSRIFKELINHHQLRVGYLPNSIEATCEELETRAKQHFDITDLRSFYASNIYASSSIRLDQQRKVFIKRL